VGILHEKLLSFNILRWWMRLRTCIFGPLVDFIKHSMYCTVLSCHLSCSCHCWCAQRLPEKRQAAIFTAPVSLEDGALLVIRVLTVNVIFYMWLKYSMCFCASYSVFVTKTKELYTESRPSVV